MSFILIAASRAAAVDHDLTDCVAIVTPRSPHACRGVNAQELRVTAAMLTHPSLPFLLDVVRPCFCTASRGVTR